MTLRLENREKDAKSAGSKALSAERKASKAINRRFTQMDTERNPFKNITAEAQRGTSRQIAVSSRQFGISEPSWWG